MIEFLGKNKIFSNIFLHQIQPNESIEKIANIYGVSVLQLKQENEVCNFKPGKCILILNNTKTYHIVKPCETFDDIAKLYDTTVENIKQKNKVNTLFIGQRLEI